MIDQPRAFFLTVRTYGTWLPGDERRATDRASHHPDDQYDTPSPALKGFAGNLRTGASVRLGPQARAVVDESIRETCAFRSWSLYSLNVRTNHMHVVLSSSATAETTMTTLKAWATRKLREARVSPPEAAVWARHGSTKYLWTEQDIEAACHYVTFSQGADLD